MGLKTTFDYLVIGAGLFGSAAAKYLSQKDGAVCLIGPAEPIDWANHQGVFASHYDESRIASISAPDPILATLDRTSMDAYREIEALSGIPFHRPTGRLSATPAGHGNLYPYLTPTDEFEPLSAAEMYSRFKLRFPTDYQLGYESAPSGTINPRALARAQLEIAKRSGVHMIDDIAIAIEPKSDRVIVRLRNCSGHQSTLAAKKVLIATGAFSQCFDLLPRPLDLQIENSVSVMLQLPERDYATFAEMPPVNFKPANGPITDVSILPPRSYPDGKRYIKFVVHSDYSWPLSDLHSLRKWFCNLPDFPYLDPVQAMAGQIFPDVTPLSWRTKPCVLTYTESGKPFIDRLVPSRVYIAVGGNGGTAHTSDAIGKLAAELMVHDRWQSPLEHTPFQLSF